MGRYNLDDMRVGDEVEIWITGMAAKYVARVEAPMPKPRLRVIKDDYRDPTTWPILKMGDFVVLDFVRRP